MKKLLILLAILPFLCAFNYQKFPDLTDKEPSNSVYWDEKDIFWELYDSDEDDIADVAIGYKPNQAVPLMMMTPLGLQVIWQVDIDGVSVTYYWVDLDGDGLPFSGEEYNWAEILHDPEGDGLNGNEKAIVEKMENIAI